MTTRRFNVVRLDCWVAPAFDRVLSSEPSIALQTCSLEAGDVVREQALARARELQTNSARDELPAHPFADAALLKRCPNLLAVSANGSG